MTDCGSWCQWSGLVAYSAQAIRSCVYSKMISYEFEQNQIAVGMLRYVEIEPVYGKMNTFDASSCFFLRN